MKIRKISKTLMARMVCIQIALFAVLFGSYLFTIRYSEKTVRKNTIELNLVVMNQVQARLWEYREGLYNIASAFCQSPSVLRYISGDDGARVAEMEDMAAAFSNVLLQESNILQIWENHLKSHIPNGICVRECSWRPDIPGHLAACRSCAWNCIIRYTT